MADDNPNGRSTADDFRRAAYEAAFEPPERVVLPASGLAVILRRPRLVFFTLTRTPHPGDLTERMAGPGPVSECGLTPEELRNLSAWITEVFQAAFVEPKLSLAPGPKEISPNWLLPGDVEFILSWVVSGVLASVQDLAPFRDKPAGADGGAGGGDVSLPAVPNTAGDFGRLEN